MKLGFFLLIKMSTKNAPLPSCDIFLGCRKRFVVLIITILVTRSLLASDHPMLQNAHLDFTRFKQTSLLTTFNTLGCQYLEMFALQQD